MPSRAVRGKGEALLRQRRGVSIDSMARTCSPDANLPAVWLRHAQLRSLYRQGLLAEWQQHGTDLDDAVFRLAATIPMNGIHLDQEAFVRQLRAGSAQPELTSRSPQQSQNRGSAHPMREDVKKKDFCTPLLETSIVACIQASSSSWRGFWV